MSEPTLREMRVRFTRLVPHLITQAFFMGYECAINEVKRSPAQAYLNSLGRSGRNKLADFNHVYYRHFADLLRGQVGGGISNSLHNDGLAIDLILYKDGKYLSSSEDYRSLGEWWERLDPLARWGGRFGDGNHFSLEWQGRK